MAHIPAQHQAHHVDNEETLKREFQENDGGTGLVDVNALIKVLAKENMIVDTANASVLLRRYDEAKKGKLNFDEFEELYILMQKLQQQFIAADIDKSNSLDVKEISVITQQLGLKITPKAIAPVLKIFDENGNGKADFQEYLALIFFFQELEFQYDYFVGEPKDYDWVGPLLPGADNQKKVPDVIKDLKKWKEKKKVPTYEEFVKLFVENLEVNAIVKFFTRRKVVAPKIDVVRDRYRIKAPKRHIKAPPPPVIEKDEEEEHQQEALKVVEKEKEKEPYIDSAFALSASILPAAAREDIKYWKRPSELNEKASLFVKGVDEGDVIQGALGNCWFLSALSVVATSTDNFIEQLFTQQHPDVGHYQLRLYKNGKWRLVDVDDRLPADDAGLYFASCRDPSEFWVPIIEKAYAKLHGSYHALEQGNIADGLKDLTGECVEILLLDDPNFHKKHDNLWLELLRNMKESFLMGCAKEVGNVKAETEASSGLLVNHAYAIIDCQEVSGHKLMRVRNPWGRGEWTGAWGDQGKEWTPALLKHFEYDFSNDGTFFISYDDFVKNFNRIYVLRLLTDSDGQVWKKQVFTGEFKGESAGGCTIHPTWSNNPQFALTVDKPTKVFLNLSQPDLRYIHKCNPGEHGKEYAPIGVVVLKSNTIDYKKTSFTPDERVAGSPFGGLRDNSLEFIAQPGYHHIIIPCTYEPGAEFKFDLSVYTEDKADVREITKVLPVKKLHSSWRGPTAGGCVNEPTWLKNPQFLLEVEKTGTVLITLTQILAEKEKPEAIGIYAFIRQTPDRVETKPPQAERALSAKEFPDVVSVSASFQAKEGVYYVVMPTTFDPFTRDFTISAASPDTVVKKFVPI